MAGPSKPVWKTCLGIGCAVLLLMGLVAGVIVALNWGTISGGVSKAKATFSGLLDVQAAVRAHTGAREVKVHLNSTTGVEGATLLIEIEGGDFFASADPGAPGAREKALAVAVVARDALPPGTAYARYEIVHTSSLKVGLTVTTSQRYVFENGDLPPPGPR
ncbi:MAG: hypothetical protein NTY35_04855 [Planctomycetota bacterium]|nr:hypothetical protein [Planctomycetota bacterium]